MTARNTYPWYVVGLVITLFMLFVVPYWFIPKGQYVTQLIVPLGLFIGAFIVLVVVWYFTTWKPLMTNGLLPPGVFASLQQGKAVSVSKIFSQSEALGWGAQVTIKAERLPMNNINQPERFFLRDSANREPLGIFTALPKSIAGVFILTFEPVVAGGDRRMNRLESVEFNTQYQVLVSDRALATRVLSPDFMDWLNRELHPTVISCTDNILSALFNHNKLYTESEMIEMMNKIESFLQHSGALEKKAEPLWPRQKE